jgi:hypothetical protein
MHESDALEIWRKDFGAALRLIGWAAARLPYGMPEPVLGGQAAVELYSGGLWLPARQVELLTTDPSRLRLELMKMGFRPGECSSSDARNLWHPTIDRCMSIGIRPPLDVNVVAVEIGSSGGHNPTTIRVVGIEDLIADQISSWLKKDGRRSEITMLVQVLVELGRAGVGGSFRPAYLQRRLAQRTGGEVVLEPSLAPHSLDDPAPRMTSLSSIGCLVRRWRAKRSLPAEAADLFTGESRTDRGPADIRNRSEMVGIDCLAALIHRHGSDSLAGVA